MGKLTVNLEPFPKLLSSLIRPPWPSTILVAVASPVFWNGFEHRLHFCRRYPVTA